MRVNNPLRLQERQVRLENECNTIGLLDWATPTIGGYLGGQSGSVIEEQWSISLRWPLAGTVD